MITASTNGWCNLRDDNEVGTLAVRMDGATRADGNKVGAVTVRMDGATCADHNEVGFFGRSNMIGREAVSFGIPVQDITGS